MTLNLDAIANEVKGTPFTFTFDGELYTLPPSVDFVAAAALASGDYYGGLHRLLGEKQWSRLVASPQVFSQAQFNALLTAYRDHLGIALGESPASTGS